MPTLPLTTEDHIERLTVPGRGDAVVHVPIGARIPRPVLVAAHGRDDVPEPLCAMWKRVAPRAFVVCPRGTPSTDLALTFTYENPEALGAEIDDAVAALRARFPNHVAEGPLVYAGFSLGSYQGVRVVVRAAKTMPRVILIEGGHDPWNRDTIAAFRGGERVLFVSGQTDTLARSREVASELDRAGVLTRVEYAEGAGHVYDGDVEARISGAFSWLIEGDERW